MMADGVKRMAGPQYHTNREGTRSTSSQCLRDVANRKVSAVSSSSIRDMYIYQSSGQPPPHLQQIHHHQTHHQQHHRRLLPKEPYGKPNFSNKPLIPIREGSEESLQLLSAFSEEDEEEIMLPPLSSDSYSNGDQVHRIVGSASSVDFSEEDEDEEDDMSDLLLRLQQSQARMEHIKKMLVNQRGFIVESLKKMAQAQIQLKPKAQSTASTMTKIPIPYSNEDLESSQASSSSSTDSPSSSSYQRHPHQINAQEPSTDFRICPMCEVPFPSSTTCDFDFESHVINHFIFSDERRNSEGLLGATTNTSTSLSDSS